MRPGQNKRMRGRNNNNNNGNNRKGPNPLTRSYESNGPDVKIRGTAHHIGEKYLQLARDAQSSGDPVMAESYLQHAEHYFRLIAAAQQAQQQAAYGYQRTAGEQAEADDDGDDDDFSSLPDRFASPVERVAPPPPPPAQPYVERPAYNGGAERQPYEPRQERYERPNHERQERPQHERPYQDRQSQPAGQDARPERYDNRQDRNGRGERPPYAERNFGDRNSGQERNNQERNGQDRNGAGRGAQDGNGPARDYDNRGNRNNGRGPREFRNPDAPREPRQPQPDIGPAVNALPAFITTPVRIQPEPVPVNEPVLPGLHDAPAATVDAPTDDAGFAARPRRRRRAKAEFTAGEDDIAFQAPAPDPVGE
jgi:hypothetical protein